MFGRQAGRRNFWGRSGSRASSRRDYEREYDRDFERERRDYTRGRSNYARRDEYGQGDEVQRLRRTLDESRRLCLEQSEQRELAELKTRAIERQAGARADESAAAVTRLTARLAEASEALAEASRTGYSIDEAARVRDALEAELVVARAERTLAEAERYQYDQYDVPTATPVMPAQQQRWQQPRQWQRPRQMQQSWRGQPQRQQQGYLDYAPEYPGVETYQPHGSRRIAKEVVENRARGSPAQRRRPMDRLDPIDIVR